MSTDPRVTWTFILPMTKPMSMNDRVHWRVKAEETAIVRHAAGTLARAARIPHCNVVKITLHYRPKDSRRRDALNLVPTLKAVEDGIVDAKVIDDDTPEYIQPVMPRLWPPEPGQKAGVLWVTVERVS